MVGRLSASCFSSKGAQAKEVDFEALPSTLDGVSTSKSVTTSKFTDAVVVQCSTSRAGFNCICIKASAKRVKAPVSAAVLKMDLEASGTA